MTGTLVASGAMLVFQHVELLHVLKLYECQAATRLPAESVGSNCDHMLSSFENARPPSAMTFLAPVPRMALTMACMPAAGTLLPELSRRRLPHALPPSRQHVQLGVPEARRKSGNGSLNTSKMVAVSPLKALAMVVQNGIAEAASGIGFW